MEQAHYRLAGRLLDMPTRGCHSCCEAYVSFNCDTISDVGLHQGAKSGHLLMPPLVNGHDHIRGIRPAALGGFDLPLELWLTHMTNIPKVDPYLVAAAALGRQALGGFGAIMVHYTRPRNRNDVAGELEVVAKAANDIGIRIAVAVAMRDINPIGYGPNEEILSGLSPADQELIADKLLATPPSVDEQIRLVEEVAERIEGPLVAVQYGPYGMEWCSRPLLVAIAERSAATGRRVHMHVLESQTQREYLDHAYPQGPIHYLDDIGMLSPRLSVAHAVWIRPDEMDLLAERGVTVAVNACSNLSLRSGIAPVVEMHRRGVPLAMGMDGFSFDDDDDAFRELRLNYLLHRGSGMKEGLPVSALLHMASYGGRHSVAGIPAAAGVVSQSIADLMVLDYAALASDVAVDADEAHIVARRATSRALKQLFVAGRLVANEGRLVSLDLPEVLAELDRQTRHAAPEFTAWTDVTTRLRDRLQTFYQAGLHYCAD